MTTQTPLVLCPSKIGPYQLRGTIGSGGFSTVKLAYRADLDRYYACKVIQRKRLRTEHELQALENEIRILQQIHHPHIVALCDLFKDTLNYYLMMEFCPNGDLFTMIVKLKSIPEDAARIFMKQILLALDYLHSHNLSHRDIKPENIMSDENGNAKLTDFGLAKYAPEDHLTSTGCGSPYYVSPEIICGDPYSPRRSDMWSLGVVLYVMVSGHVPWASGNRRQVFEQIRNADYIIPRSVSSACNDLIRRLLVVKPEDRITAAGALRHQWLASTPMVEKPISVLVVSLRKVDNFFSDDDDEMTWTNIVRANCSTSQLSVTYNQVLSMIEVDRGTTRSELSCGRLPCVSTRLLFVQPFDFANTAPIGAIHSLMIGNPFMVRKKKRPKIVRPRPLRVG
jgi:serine/threonine protein kinase